MIQILTIKYKIKGIEEELGFKFIRINPDDEEDFNIFKL